MNRSAKLKSITDRCKGFTLVEVLVAILIFSIVMTTLFSSFKAFIISSEYVKSDVAHGEKIRNVLKRINMDFGALVVLQAPRYKKPEFNSEPDPYSFIGKEETIGQNVVSSVVFTSLAHVILGADQRAGVARITYYLKENQNNTYNLYRADSLFPFPEEEESCTNPVLCRDISGFELVYTDFNGDEHRYWNSDDQEFKYTFPTSIDLKITLGSGENRQVFETAISMVSGRTPIE